MVIKEVIICGEESVFIKDIGISSVIDLGMDILIDVDVILVDDVPFSLEVGY